MFNLRELAGDFVVAKLASDAPLPEFAPDDFVSITRTRHELFILCAQGKLPADFAGEVEQYFRGFLVDAQLDFNLIGVIKQIADPLAAAQISIFVVSTFDTDYVFVPSERYDSAREVLKKAGFNFNF